MNISTILTFLLLLYNTNNGKTWPPYRTCKTENHLKGVTYSLFSTLNALNELNRNHKYMINTSLHAGTLIAYTRNTKIFAWDDDADIFITLKNKNNVTITNINELQTFRKDVEKQIEVLLNNSEASLNNKVKVTWSQGHKGKNTLHVEALSYSKGFLDVFILLPNHNHTKLRNLHCCVHSMRSWHDKDIIIPVQKRLWDVYDFVVNIPNKPHILLTNDFGDDYMIPPIEQTQLNCTQVNDQIIKQWMKDININYNKINKLNMDKYKYNINAEQKDEFKQLQKQMQQLSMLSSMKTIISPSILSIIVMIIAVWGFLISICVLFGPIGCRLTRLGCGKRS